MVQPIDGNAIVYCQNAFNTTNGKTAHGLVRFTERYKVVALIDQNYAGQDAGLVLDGKENGIPIFASLDAAKAYCHSQNIKVQSFVIGLAPDGGRLPIEAYTDIESALESGYNVDSGLHDFLTNNAHLMALAKEHGCSIRDIRKTPDRDQLHFFSGKIEEVDCLKLAILGTDSAIGKRTTAWKIVHGLQAAGISAQMVGTGQTAWLQGAKYSMIMDSCINDFVAGEIEHAVHEAWLHEKPQVIVIEGQGSLLNPAYPGGFEILAAGRPDYVILQHAPKRLEYDGFPGYVLHPLEKQIEAIEVISGKKVVAITVNHEEMSQAEIAPACEKITAQFAVPAYDVLVQGTDGIVEDIKNLLVK